MMRQIFAFETKEEYVKYQGIIERLTRKLKEYEYILKSRFVLKEPPKGIVWTSEELATKTAGGIGEKLKITSNACLFQTNIDNLKFRGIRKWLRLTGVLIIEI